MNTATEPPTLPIKRVVTVITRSAIACLFMAIIGTVAVFVGCAEGAACQDGQPLPPTIDMIVQATGLFWGLVMLLLLILPIPLYISMKAQRRQRAAMEAALEQID